jgi:hypothetical protein
LEVLQVKVFFCSSLDPNIAVLKVLNMQNGGGLWIGNKAKVTVTNTNIGVK